MINRHSHNTLEDVVKIVNRLNVSSKVKEDIVNVFTLLAEAESKVHGTDMKNIHFHEVGTIDAIVDITTVCYLLDKIRPDKIIASPIKTGYGAVKCAHGTLPVPAPATALLLEGIPTYSGNIKAELCTPTGAALLKYFVDKFENQPLMKVEDIGYGFGKKNFKELNAVRILYGTEESYEPTDNIIILQCNIDDMSGEEIGSATNRLLEEGAKDVFTESIMMKKNRPAILLNVITDVDNKDKFINLIFKLTTTLGIREIPCKRYILDREIEDIYTNYGLVRKKISQGYNTKKVKLEYDDIERISKELDIPIFKIRQLLEKIIN